MEILYQNYFRVLTSECALQKKQLTFVFLRLSGKNNIYNSIKAVVAIISSKAWYKISKSS
jgi:hypothetical protein